MEEPGFFRKRALRKGAKPAWQRLGLPARAADMTAKAGPVVAVALTIMAAIALDLGDSSKINNNHNYFLPN